MGTVQHAYDHMIHMFFLDFPSLVEGGLCLTFETFERCWLGLVGRFGRSNFRGLSYLPSPGLLQVQVERRNRLLDEQEAGRMGHNGTLGPSKRVVLVHFLMFGADFQKFTEKNDV